MNLSAISTTQIAIAIAVAFVVTACIGISLFVRKRRTYRLRNQFGDAEYSLAVKEGGSKRRAEAVLDKRVERVKGLHIKPVGPGERARFIEAWEKVQARFVDDPGGAVTDADQLLGDVMSARDYPVGDFDQRAADISVDHALVLANYRAGHQIALRQAQGQANTEDLRQAMINYRTLFDGLLLEEQAPPMRARAAGVGVS
jgi:hypothetical protein